MLKAKHINNSVIDFMINNRIDGTGNKTLTIFVGSLCEHCFIVSQVFHRWDAKLVSMT